MNNTIWCGACRGWHAEGRHLPKWHAESRYAIDDEWEEMDEERGRYADGVALVVGESCDDAGRLVEGGEVFVRVRLVADGADGVWQEFKITGEATVTYDAVELRPSAHASPRLKASPP